MCLVKFTHLEVVLPREPLVADGAPDALAPHAARRAALALMLRLLQRGRLGGRQLLLGCYRALGLGCVDEGDCGANLGGVRGGQVVAQHGRQLEDLPTEVTSAKRNKEIFEFFASY